MKTIGLLGGMTSESSAEYYRLINEITRKKLGGIHSAQSVMYSVDFAPIEEYMETGQWNPILEILVQSAKNIENAGADLLVICTNTMHKFADQIQANISIPLLSIIDATARAIKKQNIDTVALLGTRFTMKEDFYKNRLTEKFGINVLTPTAEEMETIHRIIMNELSIGKIENASKQAYWQIINRLASEGAGGAILGCTEIPLLVKEEEGNVPLFDTTYLHAAAAVDFALS